MDEVISNAKGDISSLERGAGLNPGALEGTPVRVDILTPKDFELRIPSGNELGANPQWIPGGKLPNGNSEAVINRVPLGKYTVTRL